MKFIIMESIHLSVPQNIEVSLVNFQKMNFIYNAIQNGWEVKIIDEKYIFTKKHEGKREVFQDSYLKTFIEKNMDISDLLD